LEWADFDTTVEVDPNFGLGVKGAKGRAVEVFAECLLIFAEVNMVLLHTCC
jgi:hypothetical protein